MTIIVEDGSIVAGANSFATAEELRQYGADRGEVLPVDDDEIAPNLILASDYIWQLDGQLKGVKVDETQGMPFPRSGIIFSDGTEVEDNIIPAAVKRAFIELAFQSYRGIDIVPVRSTDSPELKRKKVGPIEKEWFQGSAVLSLPTVSAYLAPYMRSIAPIQVVRV